ncbi:MAG: FkbM family methyltransferase [Bacteroidia bacterium]
MFDNLQLKLASLLYQNAFPVYRKLYFGFKNKKDAYNLLLASKLIKPGANVLDIGANVGFYGRHFVKCVGSTGHVYCFEPDVINYKHLQHELKGFSNVTLLQKAVAAESGSLTLYTSDLLNIDHRTYEPEHYSEKYSVEKISIDGFVNDKFKVDFIKMDIQGFEMDALKGMTETLKANREIVLLTEFWPYGLQAAGSSATAVFDFLKQLEFNIYKVADNKLSKLTREEVAVMKVEFLSDTNVLVSRGRLTEDH